MMRTQFRCPLVAALAPFLARSAAHHSHLCPRQVLGVRMGLCAGNVLGFAAPDSTKQLLTIVETDGCAADGISAATGCTVGNRRLRMMDFGKVAATFVDLRDSHAVRVVPRQGIRQIAQTRVPDAESRWHAQLIAYQTMTDVELLDVRKVELCISLEKILSKHGRRVNCEICGEEIINEREVIVEGTCLCQACAGQQYYH